VLRKVLISTRSITTPLMPMLAVRRRCCSSTALVLLVLLVGATTPFAAVSERAHPLSSDSQQDRDDDAPLAPCDLFASGGTPCTAAHSTVRALYNSYAGPLYSVKRVGSDGCGKGDAIDSSSALGSSAGANSTGGLCGCTPDGKTVTLTCPAGTVTAVTFASIGTPGGACGNLTAGSCHGDPAKAKAAVEKLCVGKNSCTIVADIQVWLKFKCFFDVVIYQDRLGTSVRKTQ
jgi:hypothetical protein